MQKTVKNVCKLEKLELTRFLDILDIFCYFDCLNIKILKKIKALSRFYDCPTELQLIALQSAAMAT
jgi:hypothetical protein